MAFDQLKLYNNALSAFVGQTGLSALTDDVESRYLLDNAYTNAEAVKYCLELVKPRFAAVTAKLNTPTTPSSSGYTASHTLPTGFIVEVGLFSDDKLDQPISRFMRELNQIVCDYSTVYLRYIKDPEAFTYWTPSFAKVVAMFLAREIAPSIAPKKLADIETMFKEAVQIAIDRDGVEAAEARAQKTTVTLSNTWRHIYNDALFLMGLKPITSNTDDSNRRTMLDRAYDTGVVKQVFESTAWGFGYQSVKINYNPSIEPAFGYQYGFAFPPDFLRLEGIYSDEYFINPIGNYVEEDQRWFCSINTIYVQYIDVDFLTNPNPWPMFFKKLIAAELAQLAAGSLAGEGAVLNEEECKRRIYNAMNENNVLKPPKVFRDGKWVGSRYRNVNRYKGRP